MSFALSRNPDTIDEKIKVEQKDRRKWQKEHEEQAKAEVEADLGIYREWLKMKKILHSFFDSKRSRGCSERTIINYRLRLRNFLNTVMKSGYRGDISLVNLDLRRYEEKIRGKPNGEYNLTVSAVRSFLKWCFENDLTKRDWSGKLKLRPQSQNSKKVIWYSVSEINKLLDGLESKEKLAVKLIARTEMRRGRNKKEDVNFAGFIGMILTLIRTK